MLDVSYNEFSGDLVKPLTYLARLRHFYYHSNPFAGIYYLAAARTYIGDTHICPSPLLL